MLTEQFSAIHISGQTPQLNPFTISNHKKLIPDLTSNFIAHFIKSYYR